MTWESSDPTDIRAYFIDEFPEYREKLPNYVGPHTPTEYAIAFRDEHPVSGSGMPDWDFIRRSTWATDGDGSLQHKHFPVTPFYTINKWSETSESKMTYKTSTK